MWQVPNKSAVVHLKEPLIAKNIIGPPTEVFLRELGVFLARGGLMVFFEIWSVLNRENNTVMLKNVFDFFKGPFRCAFA